MSDDMKLRRGVREAFEGMAKEMGFAVKDIRQEVVERPWFGRTVTPETVQGWDKDTPTPEESKREGPQDFSRDDLYGRDMRDGVNWDKVRDAEQDRHRDPIQHAKWEAEKAKAEDLYGHDREQDLER